MGETIGDLANRIRQLGITQLCMLSICEKGALSVAEPTPELIKRAQLGESAAFEELVLSQQQYIFSVAMGVLRNTEDASDLTQEVFIRLFRSIHQYNGDSRFTTWLYRMVINLGRDELRKRSRQVPEMAPTSSDDNGDLLDPVTLIADDDIDIDPQRSFDRSIDQETLQRALDQLEPHYRITLVLFYLRDLKYTDIADIMQIPLNTVKSHIRRGKERLAEILQASDQTPTTTGSSS
jgi:RNA polymerase sigma-70 factor (ECF subfamily)